MKAFSLSVYNKAQLSNEAAVLISSVSLLLSPASKAITVLVMKKSFFLCLYRYAAIAVASKLSDMQLGESVNIAQLTKKDQKQAR